MIGTIRRWREERENTLLFRKINTLPPTAIEPNGPAVQLYANGSFCIACFKPCHLRLCSGTYFYREGKPDDAPKPYFSEAFTKQAVPRVRVCPLRPGNCHFVEMVASSATGYAYDHWETVRFDRYPS